MRTVHLQPYSCQALHPSVTNMQYTSTRAHFFHMTNLPSICARALYLAWTVFPISHPYTVQLSVLIMQSGNKWGLEDRMADSWCFVDYCCTKGLRDEGLKNSIHVWLSLDFSLCGCGCRWCIPKPRVTTDVMKLQQPKEAFFKILYGNWLQINCCLFIYFLLKVDLKMVHFKCLKH